MKAENIVLAEWEDVLKQMNFHRRESGYVAKLLRKLTFFDSKPSFGGMYVTKNEVTKIIKQWNK